KNRDAEILLIGRGDKTIVDTSGCAGIQFRSSQNIPDAVSIAAANQFDAIVIMPDSFDKNLPSAIKNLRQTNPKSKIFLLAQMWQEPLAAEMMAQSSNGAKLLDDYYICPVAFSLKKPQQSESSVSDVKPAKEQLERIEILEKLVMEDELTGVKNRRFVREFLRQIIEHIKQRSLQATLLIFDIDNFKQYNDLYGHSVGDNILKQAAVLMQKCCRKQDVVGRIGGDEFAVVFWNLPADKSVALDSSQTAERRRTESEHPTQVINICERFRRELNKTDLPALGAYGKGILAISGGLATFPRDGSTANELFEQADKALLEAKRSGKNRVYLIGSENSQPQQA
ncbi:MAG: diguanylate cyclase, partial [bacterium]|nr:diguanylate cyclase [bacterium]